MKTMTRMILALTLLASAQMAMQAMESDVRTTIQKNIPFGNAVSYVGTIDDTYIIAYSPCKYEKTKVIYGPLTNLKEVAIKKVVTISGGYGGLVLETSLGDTIHFTNPKSGLTGMSIYKNPKGESYKIDLIYSPERF